MAECKEPGGRQVKVPLYGVVLGRFQPLHLGHMEYFEAAKRGCRRLVIGITNPNVSALTFNEADPKRSQHDSNPFSYFIRHEMIDAALRADRWDPDTFAIVPADVNDLERACAFLPPPAMTRVFITIYDAWGDEKARRLGALGFEVEILWRRSMTERFTTGAAIRTLMRQGESWQSLVPKGVSQYFERSQWALPDSAAVPDQPRATEHD
jgi:cytidyltransferase-like protein